MGAVDAVDGTRYPRCREGPNMSSAGCGDCIGCAGCGVACPLGVRLPAVLVGVDGLLGANLRLVLTGPALSGDAVGVVCRRADGVEGDTGLRNGEVRGELGAPPPRGETLRWPPVLSACMSSL